MIWVLAEDSYYYNKHKDLVDILKDEHEEVSKSIKNLENISYVFTKNRVTEILENFQFDKIIISPFHPSRFGLDSSFFGVIEVENKHGILTTSENRAGVKEYEKLNDKLGLIVERTDLSLDDMGGGETLKDIVVKFEIKYAFGEVPKAVFLAGIMGTGKSFFAQCLAGETGRLLVSFNLAKMMNEKNPIEAFDKIVAYLVRKKGKYLLWIDEIEKMFNDSEASEHIKNKFLTFLNDIGVTIKLDAYVVMTANNVTKILEENPEIMRSGRVEPYAKVFLTFLTTESAINITKLYIDKRNSSKEQAKYISETMLAYDENRLPKSTWLYNVYERKKDKIKTLVKSLQVKNKTSKLKERISEVLSEDEVASIKKKLTMNIEPDYVVDYIDRIYKGIHSSSKLNDYPYVPAEIKEVISQLFFEHVSNSINARNADETLEKIVKSNIAIGDAGSAGVDSMLGNKDKFTVVID